MKNKRNIYILLFVVLGIWSLVIYQFFSFGTDDAIVEQLQNQLYTKPFEYKEPEKITIETNYRDPFLGTLDVPAKSLNRITLEKKNLKEKPIPKIIWPEIQYKGVLSDVKEKKKTFLLLINGKNCFMSIGDTANGILLKSGDKESIYVKYQGELNIIMIAD